MNALLTNQLCRLEAKHSGRTAKGKQGMPVYYGWAKQNKVMKREALMVIFLNDNPGPRINRDGMYGVTKYMTVAYQRRQTAKEEADAKLSNRTYTVYNIFMDDRHIKGSLEAALKNNDDADRYNVSQTERIAIRKALQDAHLQSHRGYREPVRQMEFDFN